VWLISDCNKIKKKEYNEKQKSSKQEFEKIVE